MKDASGTFNNISKVHYSLQHATLFVTILIFSMYQDIVQSAVSISKIFFFQNP